MIARLAQLADLRRGPLPENIKPYASGLSGFSKSAIDAACRSLETRKREDFEPAVPELAELQELCRKAETGNLNGYDAKYCDECRQFSGLVFFDRQRNGNRIPNDQVWAQPPGQRFAMPCPNCRPGVSK
jgi:hypothetical protein